MNNFLSFYIIKMYYIFQFILLALSLISCSKKDIQIPKDTLDPRNFKELYHLDSNSISCKIASDVFGIDKRPQTIMQEYSDCYFNKSKQYDTYILNCEKVRKLKTSYLYTTKIGTCFEMLVSYKRDFTKE